ncbi:MAG: COG3014 family protein [Nitrospiraceae bacterium]
MRWGVATSLSLFGLLLGLSLLTGCSPSVNRYLLIEQSLLAGDPARAAAIVEQAEEEYGAKSRILYGMDRGMTLHLAGSYQQSSAALEQAEEEVERLYTRIIRSETFAFLTNDNSLPYEGDAYEHVMINVVKALNYAAQGQLQEALVEARRIDHRLNVLSDRTKGTTGYRDDGFARYLSGILYEAAGDLNNAFIAYRNAFKAYEAMHGWSRTPYPPSLRSDLLRTAEALHLTTELEEYRRAFSDVVWESVSGQQQLAHVVMISYNGRAPRKEARYLDLPISLDALQLVLLNRGFSQSPYQRNRGVDSVLYGLNGRVVRVALPHLIPQKTQVAYENMTLTDAAGHPITVRSELAHDVTAMAMKSLSDRFPAITAKALARAATKFALAEAATIGAQQAAGRDAGPWVGLAVGLLTKGFAVASEDADKRSWQTLPDEIHVARTWVPAGQYQLSIQPSGQGMAVANDGQTLNLVPAQTTFIIQRVMQ